MRASRVSRAFIPLFVFAFLSFTVLISTFRRANSNTSNSAVSLGSLSVTKDAGVLVTSITPEPPAIRTEATPTEATPTRKPAAIVAAKIEDDGAAKPTLTPSTDIALLLKTGSSNAWRRLPVHLLTTFANGRIPNFAIYSDAKERFPSGFETIDALENVTDLIRGLDPAAYHIYINQTDNIRPNIYREQAGLAGDTVPAHSGDGNPEGWVLDRYKFLPMLSHAQRNWPSAKWFVYIEDDSYLFWHNIRQWLAAQSYEEVAYHGAISGPKEATFAQGGSGIVFSKALMNRVFDSDRVADLETYGKLTANLCCGDIILGDVLRDYGIQVNRGEFGSLSFRPEPPWKTRFDVSVWCEPVMTFHHLHQQDIAMLAELENDLLTENRPKVLFRDVFLKLIDPYLKTDQASEWDNYADVYVLTSNGTIPPALEGAELDLSRATSSSSGCSDACSKVESCFSWRFDSRSCSLDTGIKFGRAVPSKSGEQAITSGWMLPRLNATLLSHECWGFRD